MRKRLAKKLAKRRERGRYLGEMEATRILFCGYEAVFKAADNYNTWRGTYATNTEKE